MSNTSSLLVGATVPEVQTSVSALAVVELVFGWNNGSLVSREAHAGFCEKLRARSPRLTHLTSHNNPLVGHAQLLLWYGEHLVVECCVEVLIHCL